MVTTIPAPNKTVIPTNPNAINPLASQGANPLNYVNPNANYFSQPAPSASTAPNNAVINPPVQPQAPITSAPAAPQTFNSGSIVDTLNQAGQASDFASRSKLAQQYGIEGYTGSAQQNTELIQKYKSGFQQAKQNGVETPKTQGEGSAMVNQYTGGQTQAPTEINPIDTIMAQDKGYQTLFEDYKKYNDSVSQRESLVSEYQRLQKEAGLPELNAEMINMKNIIEGTEDDIRNEITKAGGFATESQVLALTGARNKGLIKNYNKLVDVVNNAQQNVSTMMGFSAQDREYADNQFKTQLDFDKQIIDYRDKMQTNANSAYNKIVSELGYGGLLQATGGDPYKIGLIEKTMGLQPGGLQQLASYKAPQSEEDLLNLELKRSTLATDKLQRENIRSQINERNNPVVSGGAVTLTGKPQTAEQAKANGYADRMQQSNITIDQIGSKFTGGLDFGGSMPNALQSADRQSYEQAKRDFVTAVLRRESGAAISDTEFDREALKYFPTRGDKPETVIQKAASRNTAINNLYRESNIARPVLPGQIIESGGKKYRVASDGQTLEPL